MDPDRQTDIAALDTTLTTVERVLDVDALRGRIDRLEQVAPDYSLLQLCREISDRAVPPSHYDAIAEELRAVSG